MMEFHILGQCKSLLSRNESLGYDIAKLRAMPRDELRVALQDIEQVMLTNKDPTLAYSAAMLLDAGPALNIHEIVCERSLPIRHNTIVSFIFETSLGADKDRYRHLLFKAWPLRCWTRKFVEVTASYFEQDRGIEAFVNHVVLCMLLGNYGYNTVRPPVAVRRKLYDMLDYRHRDTYNTQRAVQFRERLLGETKRVYLHALQEYICASISSSPALVRQVQHLMPFAEFKGVVVGINDKFRTIACSYDGTDDDSLMKKLCAVVEKSRSEILHVSYEKPVEPFIEYLKGLKSYAKPSARVWFERYYGRDSNKELAYITRDGYVKPSSEIAKGIKDVAAAAAAAKKRKRKPAIPTAQEEDEDEDEEEEEEEAELEEQYRDREVPVDPTSKEALDNCCNEFFRERKKQQQQEQPTRMQDDDDDNKKQRILVTSMEITIEHSRHLHDLINRFDPSTTPSDDIFRTVLKCNEAFGFPKEAADRMRRLLVDYHAHKQAKESWKEIMLEFSRKWHYAYCIFQAARRFIAHLRQVQDSWLPRNVIAAQTKSIHIKHQTPDPLVVPEECIYLYACKSCRDVKTLLQAYKNNHKQNYIEGRREVLTDLRDGKVYCKKNDVFAHMRCNESELIKIPILGKLIVFRKRVIVLCCQPDCGARAMHVDPEHTTFNEHGIACSHCTLEILRKQRIAYEQQYNALLRNTEARCIVCDKSLSFKQNSFYLMAKDTFICHRHKQQPMTILDYVLEHTPLDVQRAAFQDKKAADVVRANIVKCKAAIKAKYADVNAKRNNYTLKLLKRASVAVRGGHS